MIDNVIHRIKLCRIKQNTSSILRVTNVLKIVNINCIQFLFISSVLVNPVNDKRGFT